MRKEQESKIHKWAGIKYYIDLAKPKSGALHLSFMLIGPQNTVNFSCTVIPQEVKNSKGKHADR